MIRYLVFICLLILLFGGCALKHVNRQDRRHYTKGMRLDYYRIEELFVDFATIPDTPLHDQPDSPWHDVNRNIDYGLITQIVTNGYAFVKVGFRIHFYGDVKHTYKTSNHWKLGTMGCECSKDKIYYFSIFVVNEQNDTFPISNTPLKILNHEAYHLANWLRVANTTAFKDKFNSCDDVIRCGALWQGNLFLEIPPAALSKPGQLRCYGYVRMEDGKEFKKGATLIIN